MTPLTLSPAPLRNERGGISKHQRQKRSQSVIEFFDPAQPSNLSDLHHKSEVKNEKKYKIVSRSEDSNKAYYIQDAVAQKPRLSESKGSTQTSSVNSLTPTISQTPSFLRDGQSDRRWQKSMTHKLSMTTAVSSTEEEEDDGWMLHKQININGNQTDESSTKRRFFGDEDEFPSIKQLQQQQTPNSNSSANSDRINISNSSANSD